MPAHPSLAQLTLDWCGAESRSTEIASNSLNLEALKTLGAASVAASKAAGVALLQAAAAELDSTESSDLGRIASAIDDDAAMARLEERIGHHTSRMHSTVGGERGALVERSFGEWLTEQVGVGTLSPRIRGWLHRGWPDSRARGGVTTFYQSFCSALQRAVRQNQTTWDELLPRSGPDAATWRQWLIRESGGEVRDLSQTNARSGSRTAVLTLILLSLAGAAAWSWRDEIIQRLQLIEAAPAQNPEIPHSTPKPVAFRSTIPGPAPIPEVKEDSEPHPVSSDPPQASEQPRVSLSPADSQPPPFAKARELMDNAERLLDSDDGEKGDISARSAQDILFVLVPTKNAALAEGLTRVAQYWERRDDWAEAARLYQRAVKAYERTPAENSNPQLQTVSRWAGALRQSGRNTEAEKLYRMLVQAYEGLGVGLQPETASAAHSLAEVLASTGRLRDARPYYEQALALMASNPSDPRLERFKDSFTGCLRKLGISEPQIEADTRQILDPKRPSDTPNPP
jgi:tetratricopeptide (TPR) repeat protein